MKKEKGSILVIDDNDINRRYVKTVLRDLDREIVLAENGFVGLEYLQGQTPDLILVDIQMPLMDGFQCYDRIREFMQMDVPILAITAFSNEEDRQRFIDYGFNDYITKPVKPEVLKSTIEYWLYEFQRTLASDNPEEGSDLDPDTVKELLKYANPDELMELYKEFIKETKTFSEKLAFLQSKADYAEILSILHTIKGNAGSLGFSKLSELIARLEDDLKQKKQVSLSERLHKIRAYSSKLFENYEAQLNLNQ